MITLKSELRKELAYAIVDEWAARDPASILQTFFSQKRDIRRAAILLTSESFHANEVLVDKTFFKLINVIFEDIIIALDDWLDVYKITRWDDYAAREREGLKYGSY